MAKLIKSYENGIKKTELIFRNETYDFSMIPNEYGSKGDKPCFDIQVKKKYPELADDEKLMDTLDEISFADDDDDVFEFLQELEDERN